MKSNFDWDCYHWTNFASALRSKLLKILVTVVDKESYDT